MQSAKRFVITRLSSVLCGVRLFKKRKRTARRGRRKIAAQLFIFVGLFHLSIVHAEPRIIYQGSNSISLDEYFRVFHSVQENERFTDADEVEKITPVPPIPDTTHGFFPLFTEGLTVGTVPKTARYSPNLSAPIFVVGSDAVSLRWLQKNLPVLKQNHAVGWVVEAPSVEAFAQIRAVAEDVLLFPVDGSILLTHFQLTHYPALISERVIEQ